jgi:hypothetical protein
MFFMSLQTCNKQISRNPLDQIALIIDIRAILLYCLYNTTETKIEFREYI